MQRSSPTDMSIARAPRISPGMTSLVLLMAAFLLVGLAISMDVDLVDDSYIFLRYAQNIVEGNGAVFNTNERVEGYSSPLWTALLSLLGLLSTDLEAVAYVAGLALGVAITGLILAYLRKQGLFARELLIAAIGLASCPILFFWSASGMDTVLFSLLITAAILSLLNDTDRLSIRTTLLLILATAARMEGVMLAACAAGLFILQRRRVRAIWFYVFAIAGLILLRHAYYGSWVPNTYHAKVTFGLGHRLSNGLTYLLPALQANFLFLALLGAALVVALKRSQPKRIPIVVFSGWIMVWLSYVLYVGGDNFALFRFLLPLVPAVYLLLGHCWSFLRDQLSAAQQKCALAAFLGVALLCNALTLRAQGQGYWGDMALARSWKEVGIWLGNEMPPDTVLATVVPGALGYFSGLETIDMLGLTDRAVSVDGDVYAQGGHGHSRYHTDYIFERDPDMIVYHSSGRFPEPVYEDPSRIHLISGYALFDFVTDPRCADRYEYRADKLPNGNVVEMMVRRSTQQIAHR